MRIKRKLHHAAVSIVLAIAVLCMAGCGQRSGDTVKQEQPVTKTEDVYIEENTEAKETEQAAAELFEILEIQAKTCGEVAAFSAEYGANKLGKSL